MTRSPKNGRYYIALVLGGPADVFGDIQSKLLQWKTVAKYHFDYRKTIGKIPLEVDLIYVLHDMCGHNEKDVLKREAERRGIMYILGSRKMSHARQMLDQYLPRTEISVMELNDEMKSVAHDDKWYEKVEEPMEEEVIVAENKIAIRVEQELEFDIDAEVEADLMKALAKIRNNLRLSPGVKLKIEVTSNSYQIGFVKA